MLSFRGRGFGFSYGEHLAPFFEIGHDEPCPPGYSRPVSGAACEPDPDGGDGDRKPVPRPSIEAEKAACESRGGTWVCDEYKARATPEGYGRVCVEGYCEEEPTVPDDEPAAEPDETTPTTPTTPTVPRVSGGPAPHPGTFTYNPFQTAPPQFDPLTLDPFSNPEIANLYFPGGDVNAPVYDQFNAPTMADVEADPGYQFRRDEGLKAILNSQAARGMARGGSALKGMARWNQGHASEEYDRVYGRRLTEHGIGRTRALDQYGFELGAEQRGFRDFMQRHQADLGNWQRAFQTTAFNNSQAERVHLLNAGIGSDRWNRQFQVHQANQAGAAGAHNMNIYGFSAYMDPLLRLYGIQSGQNPTPSYFPIPMPQATY